MSEFAVQFLNEEDIPITQETIDELVCKIRENQCKTACLALDEYGEEDFLSVDMDNGWAALAFQTWDDDGEAHLYQPVNPNYPNSRETAPVCIGGQTPVLKRNALDHLELAAECVLYFARNGALYPELEWEETSVLNPRILRI